ncbi:MAG: hypothetical protein J2P57_24800 [Acidimicrobiaceae bacterium]|nr:hypothetical protein [Acidimicrobiaceae bacterium]
MRYEPKVTTGDVHGNASAMQDEAAEFEAQVEGDLDFPRPMSPQLSIANCPTDNRGAVVRLAAQ